MAKAKGKTATAVSKGKKAGATSKSKGEISAKSATYDGKGLVLVFPGPQIYFVPTEDVDEKMDDLKNLLLSEEFIPAENSEPISSLDIGEMDAEDIFNLLSASVSIRPLKR